MRGVDTDVLVRLLVGDYPEQASRAASLFAQATVNGERVFVPQIVVCELRGRGVRRGDHALQ